MLGKIPREEMFSNLLFLSHGVQLVLFGLVVILIFVFMKIAVMDKHIRNLEKGMENFVTREEFLSTFGNMWDEYEQDMLQSIREASIT